MFSIYEYVVKILMRDLVGHDRRPACFLVYLWLAADQQSKEGPVKISYRELAESIGASKNSVQAAVQMAGAEEIARCN